MDGEEKMLIALIYTESHPDKEQTFLGIFDSEDKAREAMEAHMAFEKARLPQAYISKFCYDFHESYLNRKFY